MFKLSDFRSLLQISMLEIKNLHAQSWFGICWFFANPILFFASYYFFSIYMLGAVQEGLDRYSSFLFISINLSTFLLFSNSVITASNSFISSLELFRGSSYSPLLFIMKYIVVSCITYIPVIIISFVIRFWFYTNFSLLVVVYIFLVYIMLILFVVAITLLVSALAIVVRDLLNLLQWSMFCLMFISPLGFRVDSLYIKSWTLYYLNPLNYFFNPIQQVFFAKVNLDWLYLGYVALATFLILLIGIKLFRIMQKMASDYV